MIKPSVGRVVWFWPADTTDPKFSAHPSQPCAATDAYVHADSMVNLSVTDHNGVQHARTSVRLIQEGEPKPDFGSYCQWMPFQIGQAKKDAMEPSYVGVVKEGVIIECTENFDAEIFKRFYPRLEIQMLEFGNPKRRVAVVDLKVPVLEHDPAPNAAAPMVPTGKVGQLST